jgi:hypothetical protein
MLVVACSPGGLPRLAWCSLGGAPAVPAVPAVPEDLPLVEGVEGLGLGPKLGDGASGEVFTGGALWRRGGPGQPAAACSSEGGKG